jgi:hypothetical protein
VVKEFLSREGVTYILKDVTRDPAALEEFRRLGALLPPVTVIDGEVVRGFDPVRLSQILDARAAAGENQDRA